jgi:hypothetical protein
VNSIGFSRHGISSNAGSSWFRKRRQISSWTYAIPSLSPTTPPGIQGNIYRKYEKLTQLKSQALAGTIGATVIFLTASALVFRPRPPSKNVSVAIRRELGYRSVAQARRSPTQNFIFFGLARRVEVGLSPSGGVPTPSPGVEQRRACIPAGLAGLSAPRRPQCRPYSGPQECGPYAPGWRCGPSGRKDDAIPSSRSRRRASGAFAFAGPSGRRTPMEQRDMIMPTRRRMRSATAPIPHQASPQGSAIYCAHFCAPSRQIIISFGIGPGRFGWS